jgi:hypothetical protein
MVAYGRYFEDLAHKMGVFLKNKLLPVKGKVFRVLHVDIVVFHKLPIKGRQSLE